MDLQTAFESALPFPDWPLAAHEGTLVVFLAAGDWARWACDAVALLDASERERVERKRRAQDRELTALSYACHRLLMARVLECAPARVRLGRDARGCPILAASRLSTSLSHADGLIAIAVSSTGHVGIDIEPPSRASEMIPLAERVCHPREWASLSALPATELGSALLSLWIRKEALLKAAGIGMAVEMDRFEAPLGRALALPGPARVGEAALRLFDGGGRFLAAVAATPGEVTSAWLSPSG